MSGPPKALTRAAAAARDRLGRAGARARRRVSQAAAVLAVVSLGAAAYAYKGMPQADVSLNDGGVWVTSTSQHLVARLNYPSQQVDGAIRTASDSFDVTQNGEHVLVPDTSASSVGLVDPVAVALSGSTPMAPGTVVSQGADRVMAVSPSEGSVRAGQVDAVGSLPQTAPLISGPSDLVAAIGVEGSIHSVSATEGSVTTAAVTADAWDSPRQRPITLPKGGDVAITAVGDQAVVLDRASGVVHLPNGATRDLGTPGLALQQPGPTSDHVLLASRTELLMVPLGGGEPIVVPAAEEGSPAPGVAAQPVMLQGCAYAAWSGSGQFVRRCGSQVETLHDDNLAASTTPVFRVNRDAIVLNDIIQGTVWLPDQDLVEVEDWTDVTSQTDDDADDQDDSAEASESQTLPDRTEENHAPEAVDDAFGVRPGRSTVLNILANDSDIDGDVLTAAPGDAGSVISASAAQDGLALRVHAPADATGSFSVPYTVSDGRGGSDSAVATVEIHDWDVDAPPVQETVPTLIVAGSGSGSTSVLGSWKDPDGDTPYLVSAQGEGFDVRTTNEGVVTVRDVSGAIGTREIELVVSDGQQTASGTLTVDVKDPTTAVPIANADHVRAVAGTNVVVSPLDNDTSPTGEPLALSGVEGAEEGDTLSIDQQAGTFTFSSPTPRTLYLTYDVSAGSSVSHGIVRVDVVEQSDASTPPVPENDTALLRPGESSTVAPLTNDFDPAGGILVLQSATVPDGSGVTATVVNNALLQVSAAGSMTESVDVEYAVSNGTSTATGTVTVDPITAGALQVPVANEDTAVVRVGDVVTIPVLDNDVSPSGLGLELSDDLQLGGSELGQAWISGNTIRFRAGEVAGRTDLTYTVVDSQSQTGSASVSIEVRARDDAANSAPTPRGLEASTVQGTPSKITVPLDGIDSDGDSVTLVGLDQVPEKGTVDYSSTYLTYTPSQGTTGTDTFTYVVEDRFGAQSTATVRVGVAEPPPTNTPPQAIADLITAKPGRTILADVVANDQDTDGDSLTLLGVPTSDDPSVMLEVRSGKLVVTLPQTEGVYAVRYQVSDSRGGTGTGTLTLDVTSQAELIAPEPMDDFATVDDVDTDSVATIPVLDNDKDLDGFPGDLTVSTTDADAAVDGQNLRVGVGDVARVVMYTVTDPDGLTGQAIVVVPARSSLRPKVNSSAVPIKVPAGTTTQVRLSDYISSRSGTTAVMTDSSTLRAGEGLDSVASADGGEGLDITPSATFTGRTSLTLTVADGTGSDALSASLTIPVQVQPANNTPPSLTPTRVTVAPSEPPVSVNLAEMVQDADDDTIAFSIGTVPAGFTATLSGAILTIAAADGATAPATASLEVTADDGKNAPVTANMPLILADSTKPLMTTAPTTLTSNGSPVSVDVATLATNPYPGEAITLAGTPSVSSGSAAVTTSGTTLTIAPASGFTGRIVVGYQLLDATGLPSRSVGGTVTVVVAAVPDAPTGVSATASGTSSMRVTWTPGSDHGSPVTHYTVTAGNGGGSWTCTGSPCTATGLKANQSYSFQVTATNAVGTSAPSAPSAPATMQVTPQAPTNVRLEGGEGTAKVTWTPPPAIEGYTTAYRVTLSNGTRAEGVTGTSHTFNVQPGTYTAEVCALPPGGGTPSCATGGSASVYGKPGQVGQPQITWDGTNLNISWRPAEANGSPVTYKVAVTGSASYSADSVTGTSVSFEPGFAAGENSVTVKITAQNQAGSSESSASTTITVTGTPRTPSVPTLTATGQPGSLSASSTANAGNGWAANQLSIQYQLLDANGQTISGRDWNGSATFTGLTDGVSYRVRARAVATDGTASPPSAASAAVAPHSRPGTPTVNCTLDGDDARCTFTPGATGGHDPSYQGATSRDGQNAIDIQVGYVHTEELDDGETARWCVRATTPAGTSDWGCAEVTLPDDDDLSVGEQKVFSINTDVAEAACTQQDLHDTGFSRDSCWRIVLDVSGFNSSSTISCTYQYRDRRDGAMRSHEESFRVDRKGNARHFFPHRSPEPRLSITCTQK